MSYIVTLDEHMPTPKIVLVGCGGTGGFVAEGLCRLLLRSRLQLFLVDPDRVEPQNIRRQNFYPGDEGKFKSQALAERLARQFGRRVGYSVFPFDKDCLDEPMETEGMVSKTTSAIIIGCIDNAAARRSIAEAMDWKFWWLDAGNGHNSGQVLIGNTKDINGLAEGFDEGQHTVRKLPMPSLQVPSLLVPPTEPDGRRRDCAEAVEEDGQSPTINQAMATLVLDFFYRLATRKLTNMAAYLDLEAGSLAYVPAEPKTVARMFSVKESGLMANACALGNRYHLPERGIEDG